MMSKIILLYRVHPVRSFFSWQSSRYRWFGIVLGVCLPFTLLTPNAVSPACRQETKNGAPLGEDALRIAFAGQVFSPGASDIMCEVKALNGVPATIVDVVPHGTMVKKGDWLVTFDPRAIEDALRKETDPERLEELQEQLMRCVVRAPTAGRVVYQNHKPRRGFSGFVVRPGAVVRECQRIMRVCNPMQKFVRAEISEEDSARAKTGNLATIRWKANSGAKHVKGKVVAVERKMWWGFNARAYFLVSIELIDPPSDLAFNKRVVGHIMNR